MNRRAGLPAGFMAAAVVLAGCTSAPDRMAWDAALPVLSPEASGPYGTLVVETPQGNGYGDDIEKHHAFYLYGEDGRFLDRFPNEHALPIQVRPGKYIVVGDGVGGLRKVQVEVKDSMLTHVRLSELKAGKKVD